METSMRSMRHTGRESVWTAGKAVSQKITGSLKMFLTGNMSATDSIAM